MSSQMKMSCGVIAFIAAMLAAEGRTVSVRSPDGENDIRLTTELTLSYAVYRSGV